MRASDALAILFLLGACGGGDAPPIGMDAGGADGRVAECSGDAMCDDGQRCNGAETCAAGRCVAGAPLECDDGVACTADTCSEGRGGCVHDGPDADGDGHVDGACGGYDCDDADAARYPGATEVCDADGHDEDCDPATYGFRDADGDRWPDARCCNDEPSGAAHCGTDCDDTVPSAHPDEAESCDGLDNDCDGEVDEGVTALFYPDVDRDAHADPAGTPMSACFAPEGYAVAADDCDDAAPSAHPGALEICDDPRVDEDCDGTPNPTALCNCTSGMSRGCALPGVCAAGTQDCGAGMWGACSIAGSVETCDGEDDDCDGSTDEGLTVRCFPDADGDTYPAVGADVLEVCPDEARAFVGRCPRDFTNREPLGAGALDCDDADVGRSPGATETCNGVDDDCDGMIDDALRVTCWRDMDRDGYAASGAATMTVCPSSTGACPTGFTADSPVGRADCDDSNAARSPAVAETCNAIDDDCDTVVDDGVRITCYTDVDGDGFAPSGAAAMMLCADPGGTCPSGRTSRPPVVGAIDCADTDPTRTPASLEVCNMVDDDCDGVADDGLPLYARYRDVDGDGYGSTMVMICGGMLGYADVGGDCRDDMPSVNPGQIGFQSQPACPVGYTPCALADLQKGCQPTAGGTCDASLAQWDTDCTGAVEFSLTRISGCDYQPGIFCPPGGSCCSCAPAVAGYIFDDASAVHCGRDVAAGVGTNRGCECQELVTRCRDPVIPTPLPPPGPRPGGGGTATLQCR